ncbi:FAD-binding protein [Kitasatospora sp. NPDC101176]|uniref:FAD-binding protein n=1 Tax=Kitasatospora sp. NPDC101176 TaxID=3364099 RepID=UPI0037F13FF5
MTRPPLSRRSVLAGTAATATAMVIGFDSATRAWATTQDAVPTGRLVPVPTLDGTLTSSAATVAEFSQDFGRLTTSTPYAVLRPGSDQDVVKIVNYARCNGLKVAMNGRSGTGTELESHSNYGQAGVAGGISIDARSLNRIHSISATSATVDAGVTWAQLTDAALAKGLTPPCLTDYLHLSVGGTISVGGIGSTVQKYGLQADTVESIDIVTGTGQLVTATATRNRDLFNAALAGAGQFGIILRATVKLVPAPQRALVFNLFYDNLATYLADQETILRDGRFPSQVGEIVPQPNGAAPRYKIETVVYYNGTTAPDPARYLAGLSPVAADTLIADQTYREYTFRADAFADNLKNLGYWNEPKPWLSLFLPASKAATFVNYALPALTPDAIGGGLLLFYPFPTNKITRPNAITPNEPVTYLFDLLTFPHPGTDPAPQLQRNRTLYDYATTLGAKRYLVGAVPRMTQTDWQRHYGSQWATLAAQKFRYDPARILTPGQNIFG